MPPRTITPDWVFQPRLRRATRLAFVGCGLFAALGVLIAVTDPASRLLGLQCAGFFGLCALGWLFLPREIVFGDAITIRRRVLLDKRIEYRDITSFGVGRLVARNGRLGWAQFDNGHEVDEAVDRLIEAGVIPVDQLDDRALRDDFAGIDAQVITAVIGVTLGVLLFFGVIPWSWFEGYPDWVLELVLPLGVLIIAFLISRYWRSRNRAV